MINTYVYKYNLYKYSKLLLVSGIFYIIYYIHSNIIDRFVFILTGWDRGETHISKL